MDYFKIKEFKNGNLHIKITNNEAKCILGNFDNSELSFETNEFLQNCGLNHCTINGYDYLEDVTNDKLYEIYFYDNLIKKIENLIRNKSKNVIGEYTNYILLENLAKTLRKSLFDDMSIGY